MLGPLPPLYRWIVLAVVIAAFVALGLWVTFTVPAVPTLGLAGAGVGAAAGLLVAYLLLHDPTHSSARGRRPL